MKKFIKSREFLLLISWIVLIIITATMTPNFLTTQGISDLGSDLAILIILALAQMPIILIRGIDLSVASNLAFTGMALALISIAFPSLPVISWLFLSIGIGALIGAFNGSLIAIIGIPAIVATLGTMSIWRGMIFVISKGSWVVQHQFPVSYLTILRTPIVGMTLFFWSAVIIAILFYFLMEHTRFGRELYGFGGNPVAAKYAGIPIVRHEFIVYCISGGLSGFAGWLWTSRFAMANTDIAYGFEMQTVAACVIGGVAISGGKGRVIGSVLGAVFLGTLYNVLPIIGMNQFWQQALSGSVILIAIIVNSFKNKPTTYRILEKNTRTVQTRENKEIFR